VCFISTKAQTWYLDFVVGVFIFMVCIVLYYKFVPNLESQEVESLKDTYYEAATLADSLMTEGYPANWTTQDVQRIGLIGSRGINRSKVLMFGNLSYGKTKDLLNLRSDYAVTFTWLNNTRLNISNRSVIGHPAAELINGKLSVNRDYNDLVSLSRMALYNRSIVRMVVYAWR